MAARRTKRRRTKRRRGRARIARRLLVGAGVVLGVAALGLFGVWQASRPAPEPPFRLPGPDRTREPVAHEIDAAERARLDGILAGAGPQGGDRLAR